MYIKNETFEIIYSLGVNKVKLRYFNMWYIVIRDKVSFISLKKNLKIASRWLQESVANDD